MPHISKVMFLLGSGISRGLPCINQITDSVLNELWCEGEGFPYKIGDPNDWQTQIDNARSFQTFLKILRDYMQRIGYTYPPNYEEIYHFCYELNRSNPIVRLHIHQIDSDIRGIPSVERIFGSNGDWTAYAWDAMRYIIKVLRQLLLVGEPIGLELIGKVCENVPSVDLCTLNHDIQIEKYLEHLEMPYIDGFEEIPRTDEGIVGYVPLSYEPLSSKDSNCKSVIRLIKPHGSIDWFYIYQRGPCKVRRPECLLDRRSFDSAPLVICGTDNKAQGYTTEVIFNDMWCWFHRFLIEHDVLVVSGYSFRDEAINRQLRNWLFYKKDARIIMLYPEDDPVVWKNIEAPFSPFSQKFVRYGRYFEDAKWTDVCDNICRAKS